MKHITLDPEEQEIENALSMGSLKSVDNFGIMKKKLQKAATFTLNKTRNINKPLLDVGQNLTIA